MFRAVVRTKQPMQDQALGCWVETSQATGLHGMVEGGDSPDCPSPAKPPAVPLIPDGSTVPGGCLCNEGYAALVAASRTSPFFTSSCATVTVRSAPTASVFQEVLMQCRLCKFSSCIHHQPFRHQFMLGSDLSGQHQWGECSKRLLMQRRFAGSVAASTTSPFFPSHVQQ